MKGNSGGPGDDRPTSPRPPSRIVSGGEFAGIGLQFAASILLFAFAGVWLDGRLGTGPWLTILLVFVGAGGGFFSIYRRLMAAQRRDDARRGERP